jgi:ribosome-binding factor A
MMMQEEMSTLRGKLAQRIRKQVRIIPEIAFFLDDTVDEMYRVQALMTQLEADGQFGKEEVS